MDNTRSYEKITKDDLCSFGKKAKEDYEDFFLRKPEYKATVLATCLCQGGAKHYVDQINGLKDIDILTFFKKEEGVKPFYQQRKKHIDYGESKFGVHPQEKKKFRGRRMDMLGRSIKVNDGESVIDAIKRYLREGKSESAREWAKKPIVLIEPSEYCGQVIWPE